MFFAAAVPLSLFVLCRLHPPVLPAAANAAVCVYSALTALSFATALATRRVFYICGIGLLLFSDLMIGGGLVRMPGCNALIGPTYIAAEGFLGGVSPKSSWGSVPKKFGKSISVKM